MITVISVSLHFDMMMCVSRGGEASWCSVVILYDLFHPKKTFCKTFIHTCLYTHVHMIKKIIVIAF